MKRKFAKLYETELGQILVMRQEGDDGPEIRFHFDPEIEGLDLCAIGIGFSDDDDGAEKADKAFDAITEEGAIKAVSRQIEGLSGMFEGAKP